MKKIIVVKSAGFCFGVRRAIEMAFAAAQENTKSVYTLGPIIHNPQTVQKLYEAGVKVITQEDIPNITNGIVIIRSHGIPPQLEKQLYKYNITILDATCPFVKKAQNYAQELNKEGYQIILIGEPNHPEVKSILGYAGEKAIVVHSKVDLDYTKLQNRIGIVVQTTQSFQNFIEIINNILGYIHELKIYNTICNATATRQDETLEVAKKVDLMIVVGGYNSANTTRLTELCRKQGNATYHIETADEIKLEWFDDDINIIRITAGASTPEWIINNVKKRIEEILL